MKIKESRTSRKSQLTLLVNKFCGDLFITEDHGWSLMFGVRHGGYANDDKLRISRGSRGGDLFSDGEWEDLEILVFDASYFERTCKLAEEYEQTAQKSVVIVKHF